MAEAWDSLQEAALDGVAFPVERISRSGGRRVGRHVYPYRPGQDVEDMGREPLKWAITIPLFTGIDPALYPARFEQLRAILDDPDGQGDVEFTDPELGPVPAKVITHDWAMDAMRRNGGVLTINLEERSSIPFIVRQVDDNPDARTTAEVEAEFLDDFGVVSEDDIVATWEANGAPLTEFSFTAGELFVSMVDDFFDAIESARIAADEVAAMVDRYRKRISLVLQFDAYSEAENWSVVQSMGRLADSFSLAGERAAQGAPRIMDYVVPAPISHFEIAVQLYGDVDRAPEIITRNPQAEPLRIPAGTTLRVLNR